MLRSRYSQLSELVREKSPLNKIWPPPESSQTLSLPGQFNRKLFCFNARHSDGRSRSTVLTITSASDRPLIFLTREEFDALMAIAPDVNAELVNFAKKKYLFFVSTEEVPSSSTIADGSKGRLTTGAISARIADPCRRCQSEVMIKHTTPSLLTNA
jgi:hypothetical protein